LLAEELTAEAPAADRYIPADPLHNVPGDPLELPADPVLLDQAIDTLVPALAERLQPLLAGPTEQLLLDYRTARDTARTELAREAALSWLCAQPQYTDTAHNLLDYVKSTLETQDARLPLEDLFRTHVQGESP
jgi:hypothetical protein